VRQAKGINCLSLFSVVMDRKKYTSNPKAKAVVSQLLLHLSP
jgi:hypothetical protein